MEQAWLMGLLGGLMIGCASALMFAANGRITGISGILGGLMQSPSVGDRAWRWLFLAGLVFAGLLFVLLGRPIPEISLSASSPLLIAGGLLVGFGTRRGSGCTSGHGVCGMARLSPRSFTATFVFMLVAALTVFVMRHGGLV
ncbi:MAG: YeeE/YedE family protein [Moraxellaceae bacterium]|nr:YeeE/YedE family protein [Moraxellaceae bacterium]MDP1775148.1 YeeE/YedE family protein [Moraxellaceae bacterium]MDZ4297656.1 YeeE/YedE family protein [Moraxellaceae bacterium]MDZ4385929.1 YeeE/YedE family protein [Moraxellaceae bacterium]